MSETDPTFRPAEGTPQTSGFQLQVGPCGKCRLILGEAGAEIAILTLSPADADRLAHELRERRHTYDKASQSQGRSRH
ncbi:hypothetical protein INQ13_22375 [Escherichia coli]|uniref:hypothetical protein n=1 Tax=Escherichia coli TaxID=562 RepID=UPI001931A525|nr:hypothetical protein [Escherichia coli]MBL7309163.1 hypothetical protein [Escherichia coli]MBL7405337.1 hypothetical protein [Escherichia coli]